MAVITTIVLVAMAAVTPGQGPNPTSAAELLYDSPQEQRYVTAVDRVLKAVNSRDADRFKSYFTTTTIGMQPDELWTRAFVVLSKFGSVHKIEFSEMDGDAAFVKVHFERAAREFVVQFDEAGKLRELTYVPPAVH